MVCQKENTAKMRILVAGLGKLGMPMACVFANADHQVVGLDCNENIIKEFQEGRCSVNETGLYDLFKRMRQRMEFTADYGEAKYCDMSFVIVPTPSDMYGRFISKYVLGAVEKICENLGKNYHNIVITSTVMPGTMENEIKPLVEKTSGRKVGKDIGVCYSPEFIALGSVIKNMQQPDSVLIGESDEIAGSQLKEVYESVCHNAPTVARMSWGNAEVAKLMLNVCVTTKIGLANSFAEICERIPGGDIDIVTDFLGLDSRIGRKFLRGGLGYGGPCFPRDSRAFIKLAEELITNAPIQKAVDELNRRHTHFVYEQIRKINGGLNWSEVAVLGVTYKPFTPIVEESVALELVRRFAYELAWVRIYDPMGMEEAAKVFNTTVQPVPESYKNQTGNPNIIMTHSIDEALIGADACVIATPWPEFKDIRPNRFTELMKKPVVYDCWRLLDGEEMRKGGVEYYALGVNNEK